MCYKIDRSETHYAKWNTLDEEKQLQHAVLQLKHPSENRIVVAKYWKGFRGKNGRERLDLISICFLHVWATTTNPANMYNSRVGRTKDRDTTDTVWIPVENA